MPQYRRKRYNGFPVIVDFRGRCEGWTTHRSILRYGVRVNYKAALLTHMYATLKRGRTDKIENQQGSTRLLKVDVMYVELPHLIIKVRN